jgi:hypothetical protein
MRSEELHRAFAVLQLRAFLLACDDDARGFVGDAYRGLGLVDVLSAGALRAVRIDLEVGRVDLDLDGIVAVDVWIRPLASVTGTRCTRWTPLSCLKRR